MFNDTITRLIRTYVPIVVGALIANLPFLADIINTEALTLLVVAGYYGVAAYLETLHPAFGYLLGVPKTSTV